MSPTIRTILGASLFSAVALAQKVRETTDSCGSYTVDGMKGAFADAVTIDFSNASGDVGSFLDQNGFYISDYNVESTPVAHRFSKDHVTLGDGVLEMKVSAYTSGSILSSEIASYDSFLHGSVRVTMKSSKTAGVCEGIFFYKNDNQETDIELLTTTSLEASDSVPAGYWTTNQAVVPGGQSTSKNIAFGFNPTDDFHEYRIDWAEGSTTFFVDGTQVNKLTDNVPTEASAFIFNAWSSGDKFWSAGPPTADSVTQIRKIELYKGYLPKVQGRACSV
ncbi:glycoside hydrolase family 16 protein [Cylindrobasidium torrendii FP15055 ss-10]|uniref:Glycoside hydrolase family 16 protein n=1 Tax=Cylindrobasidium torrendii FP15055 ss-10 TaxID=1314674 RepID=A0A0D7BRY1_9AGAR|nr:glycoside hydrolase family 16 protein [Cylindrobasidium torrendii FP15055 ss-10]